MSDLDELAAGRSRAYHLFASLFLRGLAPEADCSLAEFPELAELNARREDILVEHERVFGFNVFPYEGAFRNIDGRVGGECADRLVERYRAVGFAFDRLCESPDHLGVEFECLSVLCAAQCSELSRQSVLIRAQHDFLHEHLLSWLPLFVLAVKRQGSPTFEALATLTLELVLDHASSSSEACGRKPQAPDPALGPTRGEPAKLFLDRPETGLSKIAERLLQTSCSGLFLSRGDLVAVARRTSLSVGFGDRHGMLIELFRSAIAVGFLPVLLAELDAVAVETLRFHASLESIPASRDWMSCLNDTRDVLRLIGEQAAISARDFSS